MKDYVAIEDKPRHSYKAMGRSAVYPTTKLKDELKLLAVQMKRPMYELIDEAIEDYLKGK